MNSAGKPTVSSVAIVVKDDSGRLLVVKRDENDEDLPGVWGLPAATIRSHESPEEAALRAGTMKLGVALRILGFAGDETLDQGAHINHLREYDAEIVEGTPKVPQADHTVSQYADLQFTSDPAILFEAARRGSLCSRIYLRNSSIEWQNDSTGRSDSQPSAKADER